MLLDPPAATVVVLLLCAVPAACRWWWERRLAALADDPVLPERLLALQRRHLSAWFVSMVAVGVLGNVRDLLWAVPLMLILRMAAGYPLRRVLFAERWSLASYLSWMLRLSAAMWGFWLLVGALPALARAAGSFDALVAFAGAVVLSLWSWRYPQVFAWITGARPLPDGPLLTRFTAVSAASTASLPRFEVVDLRGGAIVNAVALPNPRGSRVIFTDTLLRLMDADEAAAIAAHEIAHLEYYDATRLRRLGWITTALVAAAAISGAAANRYVPALSIPTHALVWVLTMMGVLTWIARDRQKNETASDLRALELTGDADALIRALTKLHEFARVPRRWDREMEAHATHPSLARRLSAIRAAAGTAARPLDVVETVAGADGTTTVTFERDRLVWKEGEAATHLLPYAHLAELRVHARVSGGARLVAVERSGRSWALPLEKSEAARAQAILDGIDAGLAEPAAAASPAQFVRLAGAVAAICAFYIGHVVFAILALAASATCTAALTAAAGAASLGTAWILASGAVTNGGEAPLWAIALLAIVGAGLIVAARALGSTTAGRFEATAVAMLAMFAALSAAMVGLQASHAVRLYQASVAMPSATLLPLALAAALALKPFRAARLTAVPIAAIGVMMGVAGTGTFLHAFGRDPFLVRSEPLAIEAIQGEPAWEATVPGRSVTLRVSPSGRYASVMTVPTDYDGSDRWRFQILQSGAPVKEVAANDFAFVDDDRVLTLERSARDAVVREVTLPELTTVREHRFADIQATRLVYFPASRRWLIYGTTFSERVVSVEGHIDSADVHQREWMDDESAGWPRALVTVGNSALVADTDLDLGPLEDNAWSFALLANFNAFRTTIRRFTPAGAAPSIVTHLHTSCAEHLLEGTRLVCGAFDGNRTQVVAMDPANGSITSVGSLDGQFHADDNAAGDGLSGWLDGRPISVDVRTGRVLAVPHEAGVTHLTASAFAVGVLSTGDGTSHVRVYRRR